VDAERPSAPPGPTKATAQKAASAPARGSAAVTGTPRSSMTTRAAVLLAVLAVLAASYALPVRAWLDQRSQLAELTDQRDALAAEVAELRDAAALWDDPAYVRAQARERLNFVLPGEVGLIVLGTEATPEEEPVTGTVVPAPGQDQPWWSTLVAAFTEVGNADLASADESTSEATGATDQS
jgi:cell division protein FtsB